MRMYMYFIAIFVLYFAQDQLYHARTEDDDDNIGHSGHIIDPHKKHESANHYHVEQYPDDGGHSIRRSHRPIDEEETERRTFSKYISNIKHTKLTI